MLKFLLLASLFGLSLCCSSNQDCYTLSANLPVCNLSVCVRCLNDTDCKPYGKACSNGACVQGLGSILRNPTTIGIISSCAAFFFVLCLAVIFLWKFIDERRARKTQEQTHLEDMRQASKEIAKIHHTRYPQLPAIESESNTSSEIKDDIEGLANDYDASDPKDEFQEKSVEPKEVESSEESTLTKEEKNVESTIDEELQNIIIPGYENAYEEDADCIDAPTGDFENIRIEGPNQPPSSEELSSEDDSLSGPTELLSL